MKGRCLIPALLSFILCVTMISQNLHAEEIRIKVNKKYLNIPVSHQVDRNTMTVSVDGKEEQSFLVRLADDEPDYWVFCDLSAYKGKTITISYDASAETLNKMFQDDQIVGQDKLYQEENRPQFHFTTRRGWINDPNGLIYYDGEYHLFYQHNPYEREWENMHWGHAVSKDLIHWEELSDALYPDELGGMFSGSAVMDWDNTAGFNKGSKPAMIAAYTAASPDKQVQCIAYSNDNGRTFTKYEGNPLIDSKHIWNSQDTRDPKVFWYKPGSHWVMVLNERDGHSIYTSANLKQWQYESHTTGFWECPELFELPVDDDPDHTQWVMYGASGTYMLGSFDGKTFTPEHGKFQYTTGAIYAAQTYTDAPDGRRIQVGWGRISHPGMPFNGVMLLPTELSLRTTKNGVRLFSNPIAEVDLLTDHAQKFTKEMSGDEANEAINRYRDEDLLRVSFTLSLSHATSAGIDFKGQNLIDYDMNSNTINSVFYSPEELTSMELSAVLYIDKTSVEIFFDDGAFSRSFERRTNDENKGFHFWGNNITVKDLSVSTLKSIWN